MAHRQPFEFQSGHIDFADDAYRFLNGTPNIPALYSARSGYEIVNQIGVEAHLDGAFSAEPRKPCRIPAHPVGELGQRVATRARLSPH